MIELPFGMPRSFAFRSFTFSLFFLSACLLTAQEREVWVFLSEDCPVSLSQSLELSDVEEAFGHKFAFHYAFPIAQDESAVRAFMQKAALKGVECLIEGAFDKAKALEATTMPEVFVFNAAGRLVYRGRIDNSFARVGQRNRGERIRELYEVLRQCLEDDDILYRENKAVGCLIPEHKI